MFCQSCGFEYTQKTNYCKRCGEELNSAPQSSEARPNRIHAAGLFSVIALFGIVGLFLNLLSLHYLFRSDVDGKFAMISFLFGLLFIGAIAGSLIWQLSRLITGFQKSNQTPAKERVIIGEGQDPRLGSPIENARNAVEPSSIVEHTTRQMAGVYSEPRATK